jgi:hypothetical protein
VFRPAVLHVQQVLLMQLNNNRHKVLVQLKQKHFHVHHWFINEVLVVVLKQYNVK